ncbi:MAG: glycosyltransferase [Rhodobacteraceae bacterium]|jgi:glycosyltransferase involved in cell wall biosynthesis|nr:glycosyltransferase [Paracoccaceae bacterium]
MSDHLLLYIQWPLYRHDGQVYCERQGINGLRQYLRHFDPITALIIAHDAPPPEGWDPLPQDVAARVRFEPLPAAWTPLAFLRALPAARATIRRCLTEARYACIGIGGLFGDWGSVTVLEAHRMGKPIAAACDRVESQIVWNASRSGSFPLRMKRRIVSRAMARYERHVFSRAHLGLIHGRDAFDAFHRFPRHAENIHDIHLTRADHITPDALAAKAAAAGTGPLRIVYAGRIDPMKGWRDWLDTLVRLSARGVDVTADWLGSGPEEAAMRAEVNARGLAAHVTLHGHIDDRARVRAALMAGQVLMFCHKTAESPRILIEALTAGTPIVGYTSAFAAELVRDHVGGVLTPMDDTAALADAVAALASDRPRLADLMGRATRDGEPFDDASVFAHRAALIRRYL